MPFTANETLAAAFYDISPIGMEIDM